MTAATPLHGPAYELALENCSIFRPGFVAWLAENLHVWAAFKRESDRIWNRGRRHYSARTIVEVLRHESALSESGAEYKLNDHNTPDLARLYLLVNPDRTDFFELRNQTKSERAA